MLVRLWSRPRLICYSNKHISLGTRPSEFGHLVLHCWLSLQAVRSTHSLEAPIACSGKLLVGAEVSVYMATICAPWSHPYAVHEPPCGAGQCKDGRELSAHR